MNNKAISSIISISLILVVASVSVISFSSWLGSFQSELQNKIEVSSANIGSVSIQRAQWEEEEQIKLYIQNPNNLRIPIDTIEIDKQRCEIYGTNILLEETTTQINLYNCDQKKRQSVEVLLISANSVFNQKTTIR